MGRLVPYVLVGAGSCFGGLARFVLARWVGGIADGRFPLGTFLVNVSGCFVLGMLGGVLTQRALPNADAWRLAIGVGFCGGYTTFSTFELETHALLEDGAWLVATANVVVSLMAGLVAVRLGVLAGRAWL